MYWARALLLFVWPSQFSVAVRHQKLQSHFFFRVIFFLFFLACMQSKLLCIHHQHRQSISQSVYTTLGPQTWVTSAIHTNSDDYFLCVAWRLLGKVACFHNGFSYILGCWWFFGIWVGWFFFVGWLVCWTYFLCTFIFIRFLRGYFLVRSDFRIYKIRVYM